MRFGLIGLGAIGQIRRIALDRAPGCSLTAACDMDRERARSIDCESIAFPSAEALIASDACDAVIISTPPDTHEKLTVSALESGKHVLVEKPMASSAAACRRMVEASGRMGRILTVGFNHRYFAAIKVVRDAISSGAIGDLSHVRAYAGHAGLAEFKAPWMYSRNVMGGGTLMDNGIHVLDLTCHLMGGVSHVAGATSFRNWHLDVEDNAFVILTNRKGIVGHMHSSWSEWKGYRFFVEAYGDRGMARAYYAPMSSIVITMDRPGGKKRVKRGFYVGSIVQEKLFGWQSTVVQAFIEELGDFVDLAEGCSSDGLIARGEDGLRLAEIIEAVYRSTETRDYISLDGPAKASNEGKRPARK